MTTAAILTLIVIAVIVGLIYTLRTTAKSGLPSKEVLERARKRSREQESREKAEQDDGGD